MDRVRLASVGRSSAPWYPRRPHRRYPPYRKISGPRTNAVTCQTSTGPLQPCAQPGCHVIGRSVRCPKHETSRNAARGTTSERGYNDAWPRLRAMHLADEPLCRPCLQSGRTTAATEVDHIVPFTGIHDPLRLDDSNLQSICRQCHRQKDHGRGGRNP